jgi:hypothetical protein
MKNVDFGAITEGNASSVRNVGQVPALLLKLEWNTTWEARLALVVQGQSQSKCLPTCRT